MILKYPAFETYRNALSCCHKSFERVVKSRVFDLDTGRYYPCYTVVMK
jgi:hypothetical protein